MQNLRCPKTLFCQNLLLWVLKFLDHPHHCFIKFGTHSSTPNLSSTFTETFKGNINQNLQILILRQVSASCDFVKYIQTPNAKVSEAVRRNNWRSGRLTHLLRYLLQISQSVYLYSFYCHYFLSDPGGKDEFVLSRSEK